jgi:NADH-quinone oxidoreductase subunit A
MSINAISILILFVLAAATAAGIVAISALLGRGRASSEKLLPYECGLDPVGSPRRRFSVKFFLVAILFIVFDVEVVFLYPWAIVFKDFRAAGEGPLAFAVAAVFLGILLIGLIYAWGRGALDWEE